MINWVKNNKNGIIRSAFLVPILLVMIISISHVVSWYNLANPYSWAIYLSIAIEIAAMSSIAAASVKIKGGVWLVFVMVTLIQFIGNIFFSYNDIDVTTKEFKSWVELTEPIFEALGSDIKDIVAQKRWLALLEGGLLPIISLASLHFFIKFEGEEEKQATIENKEEKKVRIEGKEEKKLRRRNSKISEQTGTLSWTAPEIKPNEDIQEVVESEPIKVTEPEPPTPKVEIFGPMSDQLSGNEMNRFKRGVGTDKWSNG